MGACVNEWIKRINIDELKLKIGDRQVLIWGACSNGEKILQYLSIHDFKVKGFIDNFYKEDVFCDKSVSAWNENIQKNSSFIILAIERKIPDEILNNLNQRKFILDEDYILMSPYVKLSGVCGNYSDSYGNRIISKGIIDKNMVIEMSGYNNYIEIGLGTSFENIEIICKGEARIVLGNGFKSKDKVNIECEGSIINISNNCLVEGALIRCMHKSKINIGADVCINGTNIECSYNGGLVIGEKIQIRKDVCIKVFNNGRVNVGDNVDLGTYNELIAYENGMICIGSYTTFVKHNILSAGGNSAEICIGEDCMLASFIGIWAGNGHAIIDLTGDEPKEIKPLNKINIGNHVWVGHKVTILDSIIGQNCIVGANSLVKGVFESGCTLAGNPAEIKRTNVSWDRNLS